MNTGCYKDDNEPCLQMQAESDIEFYMTNVFFEGAKLEKTFYDFEKLTAQSTIAPDSSSADCKSEDGEAALYQWRIDFKGFYLLTDHYICREGEGAHLLPACPLSACEDDECDLCVESWKVKRAAI